MELTLEGLKKEGYTDEQANAIMAAHKAVLEKRFVPKERFNEVVEQVNQNAETIKERDNQLATLKKSASANEELKAEIAKLQTENTQKDAAHKKELENLRKQTALMAHAEKSTVDPEVFLSLLNLETIQVNEQGEIIGLEAQEAGLREKKAYLFKKDGEGDGQGGGQDGGQNGGKNPLNGLFSGISFMGKNPPDGSQQQQGDKPKLSDAELFGQRMAQARKASQDQASAASDHYFKKP